MSLLDKLNNKKRVVRGPGGQLTEVDTTELSQLSQSLGMPTSPTTPLGAAAVGTNPDSAKMAGTKVQKANALSLATQPGQDLQTKLRQGQDRQVASAAEQQAATRSEYLAKLGSIGDSVFQLINQYVPQQAAQQLGTTAQPAAYSLSVPPALMGKLDPQTQAELQQFAQAPNLASAQVLSNKLKLAGFTDAESNPLQYVQNMGSGEFLAKQLDDNTNVGQLIQHGDLQQNTGLSGSNIAELLGVPEEQLNNMTLAQLRQQLDAVEQQDFSRTEDLRRIMSDPNSSYAERKQARQQLRDLGAVGVVATEADIQRLEQQIESADTIRIGDEDYTVEEFLSDDTLSKLAQEYLEADTPEEKQKFQQLYGPEFVNLLEQNRVVLEDAADQLTSLRGSVSEVQDFNSKIGQTPDAGNVSSQVLDALLPDRNAFNTERLQVPELLKMISDPGLQVESRANLVRGINELGPDLVDRIENMTLEQLRATGILDNSEKWQATKSWWKTQDILSSLDPVADRTKIEALMFGEMSRDEVEAKLRTDATLGTETEWNRAVDSDGDMKVDDPAALKSQAEDLMASKQDGRLDQMRDESHLTPDQVLIRDVTDEFLSDGVITDVEFRTLMSGLQTSPDKSKIATAFLNSKSPQIQQLIAASPIVPFNAAISETMSPLNAAYKKMTSTTDLNTWTLIDPAKFSELRKAVSNLEKSNPKVLGPVAAQYMRALDKMEAHYNDRRDAAMNAEIDRLSKTQGPASLAKYNSALLTAFKKQTGQPLTEKNINKYIQTPAGKEWLRQFKLNYFAGNPALEQYR